MTYTITRRRDTNSELNKLYPEDRAIHEWYRFVLSFPPHLVRKYLMQFGMNETHTVLDPFCGTGTVLVECKKTGIPSIGIEANPMAHFASRVKVNWHIDPDGLIQHASHIMQAARERLRIEGIDDDRQYTNDHIHLRNLHPEAYKLLLGKSLSPIPLHKALTLLECIEENYDDHYYEHERLAFAKSIVFHSSNLHFGPEVGVGPTKPDAPVITPWLDCVINIANDLRWHSNQMNTSSEVYNADARHIPQVLQPASIDAVITSPPYPNEKDYTRTTRLEMVLLEFIHNKADLRALKQDLLRSNTRNVYKGDDDDRWVVDNEDVQRIAREIETRRIELGKTSGFERLYARVTKLYFGGLARHLGDLRPILRPNAHLAYVVGDQASFLRVMIPTGQILAAIGESLGYELIGIDLFRTRQATVTRSQLREEVVVFRWPGM